jgi:hypothetical protein
MQDGHMTAITTIKPIRTVSNLIRDSPGCIPAYLRYIILYLCVELPEPCITGQATESIIA